MRHGVGFWLGHRSSYVAGAISGLLPPPIAIWVSGVSVAQAVFEIDQIGAVATNTVYGEAYTDAGLTVLFDTEEQTIGAPDLIDGQIDTFAFLPFTPDGTYYCRFAIRDSGGTRISAWSNTVSEAIVTATASRGKLYPLLFAA